MSDILQATLLKRLRTIEQAIVVEGLRLDYMELQLQDDESDDYTHLPVEQVRPYVALLKERTVLRKMLARK